MLLKICKTNEILSIPLPLQELFIDFSLCMPRQVFFFFTADAPYPKVNVFSRSVNCSQVAVAEIAGAVEGGKCSYL
jgi:hypothetical protein